MVVGTNGYLWPFKPIGTSGPRNNYIKSFKGSTWILENMFAALRTADSRAAA